MVRSIISKEYREASATLREVVEPALLLATDPVAEKKFDRFLADYVRVSDESTKFPSRESRSRDGEVIEFNGLVPLVNSFTESGILVHVRENLAVTHAEDRWLVATADLRSPLASREWRVRNIERRGDAYRGTMTTRLILADVAFDGYVNEPDSIGEMRDPIEQELIRRHFEHKRREEIRRSPSVYMGHEGSAFSSEVGPAVDQELYDMSRLIQDRQKLVSVRALHNMSIHSSLLLAM